MPIPVLMPALSPTMTEGTLAKWLKREGEAIASGDVIAEVETDKATMEIEAVDDGTMGRIVVPEGTEGVGVNSVIAQILAEGEDPSALDNGGAGTPAPAATSAAAAPTTPAVAAPPAPAAVREPETPARTDMVQITVRDGLRDAKAGGTRREPAEGRCQTPASPAQRGSGVHQTPCHGPPLTTQGRPGGAHERNYASSAEFGRTGHHHQNRRELAETRIAQLQTMVRIIYAGPGVAARPRS